MPAGYTVLPAADAHWRPSHQLGVMNTDLAKQHGAAAFSGRFWRLEPGQMSPRHRHVEQDELYVVIEGTGRIRVGDELCTLPPRSTVHVEAATVRQVFNDTDEPVLWLVVGAPVEAIDPQAMTPELIAFMYPDGPKALPPELEER